MLIRLYHRAAYLAFDGMIILIVCGVVTAVLAGVAKEGIWNLGCLFVVLLLYGLASILLSYVISLVAKSQLAAFAFAAGIQGQVVPYAKHASAPC